MKAEKLLGARLPMGLADLASHVAALYLWGRLPPLPWVALVGTRRPSSEAERFCFELSGQLTRAGVSVVSGGAVGIDGAAHRGALAAGGPTLVVAPSSYERPYPAQHAELFAQILEAGGGLLSEHAAEAVAQRHVFFRRNAIMVACSAAVVLVEAPYRSGARNAALWARRLGRPLFVVPHAPWNAKGRGCITELRLGAQPLMNHKDVLRALIDRGYRQLELGSGARAMEGEDCGSTDEGAHAPLAAGCPPATGRPPAADDGRKRPASAGTPAGPEGLEPNGVVLEALSSGEQLPFELLLERVGCSVSELQCALVELDMDGRVVLGQGGYQLPRAGGRLNRSKPV